MIQWSFKRALHEEKRQRNRHDCLAHSLICIHRSYDYNHRGKNRSLVRWLDCIASIFIYAWIIFQLHTKLTSLFNETLCRLLNKDEYDQWKRNASFILVLDSMSRPLFRARTLDPNKRIRLLVDQHDDNNNDLTNPTSTQSSSSNLLVSYSSTSNLQTSQHSTVSNSQLPQRCVPQMPFVSGMEREEEAVLELNISHFDHLYLAISNIFFVSIFLSNSNRSITFRTHSMLNKDLAQQKSVQYRFQMFTKIKIVSLSIQQRSNCLNNSFVYNVFHIYCWPWLIYRYSIFHFSFTTWVRWSRIRYG